MNEISKDEMFKEIDENLKLVAMTKWMLMNRENVPECEVNEFISKTQDKYKSEVNDMSDVEFLIFMITHLVKKKRS